MVKRIKSSEHQMLTVQDGRRIVLAAVLLIFVVAASLSDGRLLPRFLTGEPVAANQSNQRPDHDVRTGSILIRPKDGNICEHRVIDNETWRIRSNGTVACDEAVSWPMQREGTYTPQSRMEAIRDGFVSKR